MEIPSDGEAANPQQLSGTSFWSTCLFRFSVSDLIKQRDPVGLGPQPHLAGIGERRIFPLKQLFSVERDGEARALEADAQAMPGVGRNLHVSSVTALAADDIDRASDTVDGFVEHDIVLKGIGPDHVVIARVSRPP